MNYSLHAFKVHGQGCMVYMLGAKLRPDLRNTRIALSSPNPGIVIPISEWSFSIYITYIFARASAAKSLRIEES